MALCTVKKITKIPMTICEIVIAKLRKDQQKVACGEMAQGGE